MRHAPYAFPVGATVTGKDAGGTPFTGVVTEVISEFLVKLDDAVITPVSLLDPLLAPADPPLAPDRAQMSLF